MDATYIQGFVEAIQNVFATMVDTQVNVQKPKIKDNANPTYDVSGVIGMSGDVTGAINISFPVETASKLVNLFAGMDLEPESEDFADAIGELVNMIAGNAKAKLAKPDETPMELTLPTMIRGKGSVVTNHSRATWLEIPFESGLGDFRLRVCLDQKD